VRPQFFWATSRATRCCAFAHGLQAGLRTTDVLGRYGGEEFIQILRNTKLTGAISESRARPLYDNLGGDAGGLELAGRCLLDDASGIRVPGSAVVTSTNHKSWGGGPSHL
jgi:hypothetical protein